MTTLRQAAQAALEAMETNQYTVAELAPHKVVMKFNDAITAMREALAQPAQRKWVGLTEFQFAEIYNKWNDTNGSTPWGLNQALEAKLRKLNT